MDASPPKRKFSSSDDSSSDSDSPDQKRVKMQNEWPAPKSAIDAAREFLKRCAKSNLKTILVPDKDADGLSSAAIIHRTLVLLGHDPARILVHLLQKGANVHESSEHEAIKRLGGAFVVVLDQGSRGARVTADDDPAEVLVVDHHFSEEFPPGALVVNACRHEPVATSSLLAYIICAALHPKVSATCDWLACLGTFGDLGSSIKWTPPLPDMSETVKRVGKKTLTDAVSLINAPRRTPTFDVISAWAALSAARSPLDISSPSSPTSQRLFAARREVSAEVERWSHTPPSFSRDGKVALLRIRSAAQVHPVIASRWAGHLKSSVLQIAMVANEGYLPGLVNFSCRIARCAYTRAGNKNRTSSTDPPVDIIQLLKAYADRDQPPPDSGRRPFRERVGDNFARGHKQASGGIVEKDLFEEFCGLMEIGVGGGRSPKKGKAGQKNTLDGYFKQKSKA